MKKKSFATKKISSHELTSAMWNWWVKLFHIVIMFLIIGAFVIAAYIWYQNVYNVQPGTEEEQKEVQSRQNEVRFNKGRFLNVIETRNVRAKAFSETPEEVKDIFFPDVSDPQKSNSAESQDLETSFP